jgi:flagellar protein FliS
MLMDDALESIVRAQGGVEDGWNGEKDQFVMAAVRIVGELRSSLDLEKGGPYAVNLDSLCEYVSRQLSAARRQNEVATLDEISYLLREARSAWAMLTYV